MPKAVTVKQVQRIDDLAINVYGVPSIVLMENAGLHVAVEVKKFLKKKKINKAVIVCGQGNNGGDGFVTARHLAEFGIKTKIYLVGQPQRLKNDSAINYQLLKRLKIKVQILNGLERTFRRRLDSAGVIVDAIFGVGLNRAMDDPYLGVIEAINQSRTKTIAVDTPSGLDCTTGKVYGGCVKAFKTVTFTFAKKGFFKNAGPNMVGQLIVADIGIPVILKRRIK